MNWGQIGEAYIHLEKVVYFSKHYDIDTKLFLLTAYFENGVDKVTIGFENKELLDAAFDCVARDLRALR